jgi:hypothetical protein
MAMSTAAAFGEQTMINFKTKSQLVISVGVVLALAFAGMVTSAYTADHIKKSGGDMSKDDDLSSAYKWSTWSAVTSALVTLAMVGVLVKVAMKK